MNLYIFHCNQRYTGGCIGVIARSKKEAWSFICLNEDSSSSKEYLDKEPDVYKLGDKYKKSRLAFSSVYIE